MFLGFCKHYNVASIIASSRGVDLTEQRRNRALKLVMEKAYHVEGNYVEVMDSGHIGVVSLMCLCIAYSHGVKCVCVQVADHARSASLSHVDGSIEPQGPQEQQDSTVMCCKWSGM